MLSSTSPRHRPGRAVLDRLESEIVDLALAAGDVARDSAVDGTHRVPGSAEPPD